MKVHELKTWPEHFAAVASGRKRHEIRAADRPFAEGDLLILREYDPDRSLYSGSALAVEVTHVTMPGAPACADLPYAVMSIRVLTANFPLPADLTWST